MSLLLPVQRAAQTRPWLKAIVETGEISLDATQCASFLKDASTIESAGFVVSKLAHEPPAAPTG